MQSRESTIDTKGFANLLPQCEERNLTLPRAAETYASRLLPLPGIDIMDYIQTPRLTWNT